MIGIGHAWIMEPRFINIIWLDDLSIVRGCRYWQCQHDVGQREHFRNNSTKNIGFSQPCGQFTVSIQNSIRINTREEENPEGGPLNHPLFHAWNTAPEKRKLSSPSHKTKNPDETLVCIITLLVCIITLLVHCIHFTTRKTTLCQKKRNFLWVQ